MNMASIKIPALGRNAAIGDLYDMEQAIFQPTIEELALQFFNLATRSTVKNTTTRRFKDGSLRERFHLLDVPPELQLHIVSHNFEVRGSGIFLQSEKPSTGAVRVGLRHTITTETVNVEFSHQVIENVFHHVKNDHPAKTYFAVTKVVYGGNIIVSIEDKNEDGNDVAEVLQQLNSLLDHLGHVAIVGSPLAEQSTLVKSHLIFKVYSDFEEKGITCKTIQQVIEVIANFNAAIRFRNNGKGVPIYYEVVMIPFWRIAVFNQKMYCWSSDREMISFFIDYFEHLFLIKQQLNDVRDLLRGCEFCVPRHEMATVTKAQRQLQAILYELRERLERTIRTTTDCNKFVALKMEFVTQFRLIESLRCETSHLYENRDTIKQLANMKEKGVKFYNSPTSLESVVKSLGANDIYILNYRITTRALQNNWLDCWKTFAEMVNNSISRSQGTAFVFADADFHGSNGKLASISYVKNGTVMAKDILAEKSENAGRGVEATESPSATPCSTRKLDEVNPTRRLTEESWSDQENSTSTSMQTSKNANAKDGYVSSIGKKVYSYFFPPVSSENHAKHQCEGIKPIEQITDKKEVPRTVSGKPGNRINNDFKDGGKQSGQQIGAVAGSGKMSAKEYRVQNAGLLQKSEAVSYTGKKADLKGLQEKQVKCESTHHQSGNAECLRPSRDSNQSVMEDLPMSTGDTRSKVNTLNRTEKQTSPDKRVEKSKETVKRKPVEAMNILLLGESGVGKSTWINAVSNYLTFNTIEEAMEKKPVYLINSSFLLTDDDYNEVLVNMGPDGDRPAKLGSSSTQTSKSYLFCSGDRKVRLIDTPGIGDTKGADKDRENFQDMWSHLSHFEEIHGICILLKPNSSRMNTAFRFCTKELLMHLHRAAWKNIVFVFSNSRGTFYRPGDSISTLESLLAESGDARIQLGSEHIYCMDNEPVRLLAALQQGVEFSDEDETNYSKSWTVSKAETDRLITHIAKLKPHDAKKTLQLNKVLHLSHALAKTIVQTSVDIHLRVQKLAKHPAEAQKVVKSKDGQPEMVQTTFAKKPDKQNGKMIVCCNPQCTKTNRQKGKRETYYNICHKPCDQNIKPSDKLFNDDIKKCENIDVKSGMCIECGCSWNKHKCKTCTLDEEFTDKANSKEYSLAKDHQTKEMIAEQKAVLQISAKLGSYIQENCFGGYRDVLTECLEERIEKEQKLVDIGGNVATLDALRAVMSLYRTVAEGRNHPVEVSFEDIQTYLKGVGEWSISGKALHRCVQEAHKATSRIGQYCERTHTCSKTPK